MAAWWDALSALEQILYLVAIPATLILLIQFILSLIGIGGGDADADVSGGSDADLSGGMDGDADGGLDAHADSSDAGGADFRFVSFRTIIAFLTIFPWTGIVLLKTTLGVALSMLFSVYAGLAAMAAVGYLFYLAGKLQDSGNVSYQNAIGKTAEVYIPMLTENNYAGKVQVIIQGRLVEAAALAQDQKEHKTGEMVRVTGVSGLSTLLVEAVPQAKE